MKKDKIKVLLVDDHAVLRGGLRMMLNAQPDMEIVGEAGGAEEARELCRKLRPNLTILDLSMPGAGGLAIIKKLKELVPGMRILVLTMHDDESYVRAVLKSGGDGYILKKAADTELLLAIRFVNQGEVYLDPSLTKVLVSDLYLTVKKPQAEQDVIPLSDRETEVLGLVARGYTNQQIADNLMVSIKTVETHKSRIKKKLNLQRRSELVRYAFQKGLVESE